MSDAMKKRRRERLPSYRLHKPSGQGVVTLSGKDFYCGRYGDPASERRYRELLAAWIANDRQPPRASQADAGDDDSLSIAELAVRFLAHCREHYQKRGQPTSEVQLVEMALRPLVEKFGVLSVNAFGPNALRAMRDEFVRMGFARTTVNNSMFRVRRMFRWGVGHELVKPEIVVALSAVESLKRGRSAAAEPKPIRLPTEEELARVIAKARGPYRAAIIVQRRTGMRAGELLQMRPCDIERRGPVWWYTPESHKTEHHGVVRRIPLGRQSQEALEPLLADTSPAGRVFRIRSGYGKGSPITIRRYAFNVHRACERAGVEDFRPHCLRHLRLTEVRERLGLDAAQAVGGHTTASMTEHYARLSASKAEAAAVESG